jgi:hypothetical protein
VTGILWLAEAVLLGWLLAWRLVDLRGLEPAWARRLLLAGTGAAAGLGAASCLFFLVDGLMRSLAAAMGLELALLAWAAFEVLRRRAQWTVSGGPGKTRTPILLTIAVVLGAGIATAAIAAAWENNPQGNWDAWAIWNLRARFLASEPGLAVRAWSPLLGPITHPDYPLLVSGLVGRSWAFGRSISSAVPEAASYVFFVALLAMVAGGVAALRGPMLGLLAALALVASPALVHEVPAQYADVPLACYIAGAVVFALLEQPAVSGILAGFALWTKDEGALFVIVFGAALLVFRPRSLWKAAAGALPAVALLLLFKEGPARGNASSLLAASLPGAWQRVTTWSRYGTIAAAFGREVANLGVGWYHPILPLGALAATLRLDAARRRDAAMAGVVALGLLVGYFGIYAITGNDLTWQLQTSLGRLLVHVWPLVLLAGFVALHEPQLAERAAPPPKKQRKAAR